MEITVYLVNIKDKSIDDILLTYGNYLNDQDIKKAKKYKLALNKKQSLISSALKNKYVKENIIFNECGKPLSNNLFFNISHSLDMVVMATSSDCSVGVDIEYTKGETEDKLIDYVCNIEEQEFIQNDKLRCFYYVWTRKEAILKLQGTGLIHNLKSVDSLNKQKNYQLFSYLIDDYLLSIATNNKDKISINIIK